MFKIVLSLKNNIFNPLKIGYKLSILLDLIGVRNQFFDRHFILSRIRCSLALARSPIEGSR